MSSERYWDKNGKPLNAGEWAMLCAEPSYRRVCEYWVGGIRVLTEWVGIELNGKDEQGRPYIFRTLVPGHPPLREYATFAKACAGHVIECMRLEGKLG